MNAKKRIWNVDRPVALLFLAAIVALGIWYGVKQSAVAIVGFAVYQGAKYFHDTHNSNLELRNQQYPERLKVLQHALNWCERMRSNVYKPESAIVSNEAEVWYNANYFSLPEEVRKPFHDCCIATFHHRSLTHDQQADNYKLIEQAIKVIKEHEKRLSSGL